MGSAVAERVRASGHDYFYHQAEFAQALFRCLTTEGARPGSL